MKVSNILTGFLCLTSVSLTAFEHRDEISLIGGYQHGKFKETTIAKYPTGGLLAGEFPVPVGHENPDRVTASLNLGVLGFDGRLFVPNSICDCNSFFSNFYLTGHAIWGWDDGNKFKETSTSIDPQGCADLTTPGGSFAARGKLKRARTYDYNIGLGYVFDLSCWDWTCGWDGWALAVEGGYSFNKQSLRTKSANSAQTSYTNPGLNFCALDDPAYVGAQFQNKWRSGFVGAKLFYETCDWDWTFGYQYHIASYRGENITSSEGLLLGALSAKLKSNRANGNVWSVKGAYDVGCGWSIGALFNYEYWSARHGSFSISAPAGGNAGNLGAAVVKTSVKSAWDAYTIAATVGYEF